MRPGFIGRWRARITTPGRHTWRSKLLSDAWWQFICLLGLFTIWRRGLLPNLVAILFASGYALLMVVHLVYESQSRYRMPAVGLLIVIIAAALGAASSTAPLSAEQRGADPTP